MKRALVIASLFLSILLVSPAFAYTGSVDFPELFKYNDQKNANLETALLSISISFKDNSVSITQELLAAIMATLDKEVGSNYLPIEENGDYGMGTDCTYKIDGSCKSTPYEGGVDYKGRGYIQITGKNNYQTYCGSDCVGTSTPELDVCGCKNQWACTVTDADKCPQVKALQPDYAARIFALYYVDNNLISLSNAKSYSDIGKVINGGEAYASDFNNIANAYLTLFSDNPDKTSSLITWLNSGTSAAAAGASNTGTQQVSEEPQGTIEGLDSMTWYNKGIALDNSGKHDEAVQAYHNAFSAEPQGTIEGLDAIAWSNKAGALAESGKYDEAVQAYDNAIKLNPRYPPDWFNKAFILSDDLREYDEAIKCLDTIFEIDPQFTVALYKKGGDFFDQGKYDEAIQCFDKVIELKSGYVASAWAAKGLALKALGRTSEAEEAYAKAGELGWPNTDYRV